MKISSINPYDNTLLKQFDAFTDDVILEKINKSHEVFLMWKDKSFAERSELVRVVREQLLTKKQELAELITMEMGKPINESIAEIEKSALLCEYYASNAEDILKKEIIETEARESYVRFDPLGITFSVMPWNYPFWQVFRQAIPAIMAGNTVLLKHANNVPQCALAIEDLFISAKFPVGIFFTLLMGHSQTELVLSNPKVKMVSLTGSETAGSSVAALAGKHIKKSILELGGSDPFIVFEDADLEKAVQTAMSARYQNAGQSCIASKRFIVMKGVKNEFVSLFKEKVEALKVGNSIDDSVNVGPLAREDLAATLMEQIEKSIDGGAGVVCGASRHGEAGAIITPTILDNVKPGMPAFDEELFGPVAAIIEANSEEEAITLANQSKYGLGAVIFSEDIEKAKSYAAKINSGNVFINSLVKSHPKLPFGGVNSSGYGRELSHYGIKEFVNVKTVWVD